eukprot:8689967-Prorocentrum_lima.AAC.1
MTSSLVGSEMCIRDSFLPFFLEPLSPGGRLVAVVIVASGATATIESVSYTHLTLPTICSV